MSLRRPDPRQPFRIRPPRRSGRQPETPPSGQRRPPCPRRWSGRRWLSGLLALALLALLAGPGLKAAWADGPGSAPTSLGASGAAAGAPHTGDSSAGGAGSFQLGKVRILGVPVLTVATPTVAGVGRGPDASTRAQVIEGNLALLYQRHPICSSGETLAETFLEQGFLHGRERACDGDSLGLLGDPGALKVEVVRDGGGPDRLVARVSGRAQPLPLLTVTEEDVQLNGLGREQLAERWRSLLERRLRFARQLMRPENLQRRFKLAIQLELGLALAIALLLLLWRRCRRELLRLEARWPVDRRRRRHNLGLQSLQALCRSLMAAVLTLLFAMAGVALFTIPGQVPRALDLLFQPLGIAAKLLLGWLLATALKALATLLLRQWASNVDVPQARRARRDQRFLSLRLVFRRLLDLLVLSAVGLWIFSEVPGVAELSGSALLASGALLGALAIVFQGLLRDFASGLVLLFDDRYAIGDSVEIQGFSGEVIDVGVLSTELRCLDQRVVVIQNSDCGRVVNLTKLRSGVELQLVLSHSVRQLAEVLALLEAEAIQFGADPIWGSLLLEAPQWRGISAVTPDGITVSLLLICQAGQQKRAERALLTRLVQRLQERAIPLADRNSPAEPLPG
ncbi:MAG: mechanosensitive ion channel domain-containing protein [Cyanobium sp.]